MLWQRETFGKDKSMMKRLVLGSAAALVAVSGAQAADLPLKAKAVEYVKVCSLYGAGFYYIPGTDTCMRLSGYLRADTSFNAAGAYNEPAWRGAISQGTRDANQYIARVRQNLRLDTRTATEYGTVRTYFEGVYQWTTGTDNRAGGSFGLYFAFIQFAGFTMGKAVSQFSTPWNGTPGNNTSYLLGGEDNATGINQFAYTAQFGNGVSASVSLEDAKDYTRNLLVNTSSAFSASNAATGAYTSSYGGASMPDIVGQIRVDQAWGLFQVSGAAHQVRASYYVPTVETSGHPDDAWGYAALVGLSLKNLPTGPGDSINVDATFANGASRYVLGGTTSAAGGYSHFGDTSLPGVYQSVGFGSAIDGVYANGTGISKTNAWGVRGAFNHNWDPYWSSSLFGAYSRVEFGGAANALFCAGFGGVIAGQGATYSCNPNFSIAQIGTVTRWTPVKNLTFSAEAMYTYIDQSFSGTAVLGPVGAKPAAVYEFKDQGTWTFGVRAQRSF
jgi:hypothetical protein